MRFQFPEAKWVPRENWHCTIKFLGEVSEAVLGSVSEIVTESCSLARPVESMLLGLGAFPTAKRARVLVVAISDPGNELSYLAMRLDKNLAKVGIRIESRALQPHITVARFREPIGVEEAIEDLAPTNLTKAPIQVRGVSLYRSHLSPDGPSYEPLHDFNFAYNDN